jgi:transposase
LFKCTKLGKVFNADLIAARNILMIVTSDNTSMTPVTPEPRKGVGVMAGDPAKG